MPRQACQRSLRATAPTGSVTSALTWKPVGLLAWPMSFWVMILVRCRTVASLALSLTMTLQAIPVLTERVSDVGFRVERGFAVPVQAVGQLSNQISRTVLNQTLMTYLWILGRRLGLAEHASGIVVVLLRSRDFGFLG